MTVNFSFSIGLEFVVYVVAAIGILFAIIKYIDSHF